MPRPGYSGELEWAGKQKTEHLRVRTSVETYRIIKACYESLDGWDGIEHHSKLSGQAGGLGRFVRHMIHGHTTPEEYDFSHMETPSLEYLDKPVTEIRPREPGTSTKSGRVELVVTSEELAILNQEYSQKGTNFDGAWRQYNEHVLIRRFLCDFARKVSQNDWDGEE